MLHVQAYHVQNVPTVSCAKRESRFTFRGNVNFAEISFIDNLCRETLLPSPDIVVYHDRDLLGRNGRCRHRLHYASKEADDAQTVKWQQIEMNGKHVE